MGTTEITAPEGLPFIDMRRSFKGTPEMLFRAHSEPDLLVRWLGPRKYAMVIDRYEVRDGGVWRYVNRDDAGNEWGFHGVFHGPQSVAGMTQTFEFEGAPGHVSLDHLTFEREGDETVVRIHSVFQTIEARDAMIAAGMESGVNDGYDRLDDLLIEMLAPTH